MQKNHKPEESFTVAEKTQKLLIPQVTYHPSITTKTYAGGAKATKNSASNKQKGRAGSGRPTRPAGPGPAVKPGPEGERQQKPSSQTRANKPNRKQEQTRTRDPDPAQKCVQLSQKNPPRPEDIPLGMRVQLDRCVVKEVEVLTRGQRTNQDWFSWRKGRITASVAHRIAHCKFVNGKSRTPPQSYLAAVTGEGPRVQTRAMSWGIEMEAEVVRRYQRLKSSALGGPISVQDCGLFIDADHPWLAASPDGIVTDSKSGQWVLEVKCPYKHRRSRVEDACRDDPAFCLEIKKDQDEFRTAPVYHLKTSHSYFTQIQCQLAVTGLRHADLVVFTLKETAIVAVTFDPEMWKETVSKLEVFYRDAVLPKLREQTRQGSAAAWAPEQ
ncbi:uncharacterized protein LOC114868388 [Betta splendens]|uniref:Uncharacterized protein LOC114868388 n=1 Tax=Betta splendens TaxID=158456 RepID=A0A6P7P622_BETSP|nr:uncharacterized protein LOC114868388 [Betta splendens]